MELQARPGVQPAMRGFVPATLVLYFWALILTLRPSVANASQLPDTTRRVIRRNINQVRACYELSLLRRATHAGRLTLRLEINTDGHVTQVQISQDEIGDPLLADCVTQLASRWQFDVAQSPKVVTYPFMLRPSPWLELVTNPRRRAELQFCFDKAHQLHPDLAGAVTIQVQALRAGGAAVAVGSDSPVGDEGLALCITAAVERWRFAEHETPFSAARTIFFQATPASLAEPATERY